MTFSFLNRIYERIVSSKWLGPVSILFFIYILLVNSWVGEDSYITFRTVENFLSGFGLRWNTYERVQAYTHPLWMFGISFFGMLRIPLFYAVLLLSWTCIAGTFYLLASKEKSIQKTDIVWLALLLVSSRAFVDYSTSGLENPLSFFLLILLFLEGERFLKERSDIYIFRFSLILALLYLNRQDTVLFGFPYLVYFFLSSLKSKRVFRTICLGFLGLLPAVIWTLFSILYYGYPFPNTAYAKLNTGIPSSELWLAGLSYLRNSLVWDPVSILTLIFPAVYFLQSFRKKIRPEFFLPLLGILLYLLYIIKIGGDFMAGRFVSLPFVAAVFLLTRIQHRSVLIFGFLCFILFTLLNKRSYLYTTPEYHRLRVDGHIVDEKSMYFPKANFLRSLYIKDFPDHVWAEFGRKYRDDLKASPSEFPVCATLNVGYFGYFAGPERKIIDVYALTDPFLSKLQAAKPWRIGHFGRNIPQGYIESVASGENKIKEKNLKEYYERLRLLTEAEDLFTRDRLFEIFRENIGINKQLIDQYKDDLELQPIPAGTSCGLGKGF